MRFIFFLIGPDDESTDYHEVGRAMATLMSDAVRGEGEGREEGEEKEDVMEGGREGGRGKGGIEAREWREKVVVEREEMWIL